jgi:hypothetical protein
MKIAVADSESDPNLYPHTKYNRGFDCGPTDTMIDVALREYHDGPFDLGCEDLETIAASLLMPWRDPPAEVRAQAEAISEAYRHDMGLVPWRPGRRGIVNPYICHIARLCFANATLMTRRAAVYKWLLGRLPIADDWTPPTAQGMSCGPVTLVVGELWQAWEVSPVGVTDRKAVGIHPGARHLWRLRGPVKFRENDGPHEMIGRVLDQLREAK